MRRLRQEARTASAIEHENIVDVTDLGRMADGSVYVIMELLRGQNLASRLAEADLEDGRLPDEETRSYTGQILAALGAAHSAGVIHRDLKPQNVFLAENPGGPAVVKLVDFGISKVQDPPTETRLTETGQVLGTPLYMAPEQGRSSKGAGPRADLYSAACVAFEMLLGRVPFEGETAYDCVILHATEPPPDPAALRPDLPEPVVRWLLRGMEKRPADRFADADEMRAAWEQAWAPAWGDADPAERPPLSNRLILIAAGGAALVAGLAMWTYADLRTQSDRAAQARTEPPAALRALDSGAPAADLAPDMPTPLEPVSPRAEAPPAPAEPSRTPRALQRPLPRSPEGTREVPEEPSRPLDVALGPNQAPLITD